MVEIADVKDRESLEAWLTAWAEGRSDEDARPCLVSLAFRSAMRVLPEFWRWSLSDDARGRDLTALVALRPNLFSGVAALAPTAEIIKASAAASYAASYAAAASSAFAASASSYAADAASDAASAAASYAAAYAAANAANAAAAYADPNAAASDAAALMWSEVRVDLGRLEAGEDLMAEPIWGAVDDPFADAWAEVRDTLAADPNGPWRFWLDWYANAREGRHLPLDLWEQIALIDNAIWKAGPEAVAEEIARLQLDYARTATPNAEDIRLNEDGRFEAVPRGDLPVQTLQDARDRIGDVIDLIRRVQGQNQYSALGPEADLLASHAQRYGDNPLRLFEVCQKALRHLTRHQNDGLLPDDDNVVEDVQGDLQNTADDIYTFDGDVREAVDARARLRFKALPDDAKARLGAYTEAVAQQSEPELALQLREDWLVVENENEPTQDTADNRYRLGSRLSRITALARRTGDNVIWTAELGQSLSTIAGFIAKLLGF